jgi:hypothetical protein
MATFDYTKYNPPGVYTESVPGPQLSVTSNAPNAVAVFGESVGYRTYTETLVIPNDSSGNGVAVNLTQPGAKGSSLIVRNAQSNAAYALNTDYTVATVAGSGSTLGDGNDIVSLKRVTGGALGAASAVQVSYQYTDAAYYNVATFYDFDDLRDHYGPAFDSNGNIISELTLAASFIFQNGAQIVIAAATTGPTTQNYIDALAKLENEPSVSIITTTSGDAAVLTAVNTHVTTQSNNRHERRAILGLDGTVASVTTSTKQALARSFNNKRVAIVSPSAVKFYNTEFNRYQELGGQYVACSVAGQAVGFNPAMPLTKKTIFGFSGLKELISEQQKNTETQAGLMVVEQFSISPSNLRIRHGVTTSTESIFTKEWNICGQEDALSFQVRAYLDSNNLIGGIINELTLVNVKSATASALENLVLSGTIIDYNELKVRQLINSPDVIEVRFAWRPSLPLNYIVVRFSIDVSSGTDATSTV